MADKKVTKKEVINAMLQDEHIAQNEMFVSYLEHELELLNNKANNKKATKNQEENKKYADIILNVLGAIGKGTVTEIQKSNAELGELSNQRVSAILKQMCEDDTPQVAKTTENRKTIFYLIASADEEEETEE
jgi:hypothetical protein